MNTGNDTHPTSGCKCFFNCLAVLFSDTVAVATFVVFIRISNIVLTLCHRVDCVVLSSMLSSHFELMSPGSAGFSILQSAYSGEMFQPEKKCCLFSLLFVFDLFGHN